MKLPESIFILSLVLISLRRTKAEKYKPRCPTAPTTSQKVEKVIRTCQEEVKVFLLEETLNIYEEHKEALAELEALRAAAHEAEVVKVEAQELRRKRSEEEFIHPALLSGEERWIAGCVMQCIFRRNDVLDKNGWPTLDGLVALYTDGVNDQKYFMNALRSADQCLKGVSLKYGVNRNFIPVRGQGCDVAFDIFDCISDKITEYCSASHFY